MPGSKLISLGSRKGWIFGGLVVSLLLIILATRFGDQLAGLFQKDHRRDRTHPTEPATWQSFDERLSLRMPVPFGRATDVPLEKLPLTVREKLQNMTQRAAYFNGVYIVVMRMLDSPGSKDSVEDALFRTFSRSASPRSPNMPKIDPRKVDGVYESGAIRFPAVFGQNQGQMTAVVIQSGTAESFWCINAWGRPEAADLAEKTARNFLFK
jgi:hypothetical protein